MVERFLTNTGLRQLFHDPRPAPQIGPATMRPDAARQSVHESRAMPTEGGRRTRIDQPPPIPNELVKVWDLVKADMAERDQVGIARYGTPLQPNNGRDALSDAYAEALDLVVYLRQALYERDGV